MLEYLQPGRQHLSRPEKSYSKEAGGEVRLYTFAEEREQTVQTSKIRNVLRSLAFYAWKPQASGLTESLPSRCAAAIGPAISSGHPASCIPPAPQQSVWWVAAWPASQIWEPSFTSGARNH